MGKILAISDVHIGYINEDDIRLFKAFLNDVSQRQDIEHFYILGDLFDMWRRDVSGLFLENSEIVQALINIKNKNDFPVHFAAGNHDLHLSKLEDHGYPFSFEEFPKPLVWNGATYIFKHGHDLDRLQCDTISEVLCYNLSDDAGNFKSDFWEAITSMPDVAKCITEKLKELEPGTIMPAIDEETRGVEYLNLLMQSPNERMGSGEGIRANLESPFKLGVEKRAAKDIHQGQVLIFGHTHRPFVNSNGKLANTGSWIGSEKAPSHTFIEIDEKGIHLFQYDGQGHDITKDNTTDY